MFHITTALTEHVSNLQLPYMAYWQHLGELVYKRGSQEETVSIHDATDDAREALEPASSPSEGERKGHGVGDDGSSLHSQP